MKKHPPMNLARQKDLCPFTPQLLLNNVQVSKNAFSRYIKKATFVYKPQKDIKVYQLPCGCSVWVYKNGLRELSLLPF